MLDAAHRQPFIEGGQPIASGLALVEPDPHMLIAFNAAPGTIAPNEQGPYGVYAQSLAEMIRTGGLPLPEVFNRVRLRVNETSKGAQVPWDAKRSMSRSCFSIGRRMRPRKRPRIRPPRSGTGLCAISVCRTPTPQHSNATVCKAMRISWLPIPAIR